MLTLIAPCRSRFTAQRPKALNAVTAPPNALAPKSIVLKGNPDLAKISTSYAERNNGIIRQHCNRYARLTLAFSKKVEKPRFRLRPSHDVPQFRENLWDAPRDASNGPLASSRAFGRFGIS